MTKKISQLPNQASPTTSDKVPLVSGGATDYALLSDLITLFFNNIPTGAHSDVTRFSETGFDYVKANTCVWSGDSYGVNKNASMTSGFVYINGRRIPISAVTARVFTASKDTYVDVLDNQDGTGTLVYTEVTNNAASPALASNSIRIGIIVTGATTIAAAGSINQGQETKVLPIASSIPYTVTDSLGNLICSNDPNRKTLGYRQITANFSTAATPALTDVTGLSMPIIPPTGRKVLLEAHAYANNSSNGGACLVAWDIVEGSTVVGGSTFNQPAANLNYTQEARALITPSAGLHTYKVQASQSGAGTLTVNAGATTPVYIIATLA